MQFCLAGGNQQHRLRARSTIMEKVLITCGRTGMRAPARAPRGPQGACWSSPPPPTGVAHKVAQRVVPLGAHKIVVVELRTCAVIVPLL